MYPEVICSFLSHRWLSWYLIGLDIHGGGGLFFGIDPVTYWINTGCQGAEKALPEILMVLARHPCTCEGVSVETKNVSVPCRDGWTALRSGVRFWSPVFRRACLSGDRSIEAYQGMESFRQERWKEFSLAKWKVERGDNCCRQTIKCLVSLGEKKAVFPGVQTFPKSPAQTGTCNAWIISDSEVLGVENMFICWIKGWCFVLACSFMCLNQGCRRSFPLLHSRAPVGSLSLVLNLWKFFHFLSYLFLGQDKCKMPLNQEVKSFS